MVLPTIFDHIINNKINIYSSKAIRLNAGSFFALIKFYQVFQKNGLAREVVLLIEKMPKFSVKM